jgi:RimJ/RimL family protein N-acetyltransferase
MPTTLTTARLRLVPMPISCAVAKPEDRSAIAGAVGAQVPEWWPVEHYDQEMLDHLRALLEKNPEEEYVTRYIVLQETNTVIGMIGSGPPDDDGAVVIGYSVLPQSQRRGFASESLTAIIEWARNDPRVRKIVGFTYPHLTPSIRTMERCGLRFSGDVEEGTIRYELVILNREDGEGSQNA